jgi:hypothetical protein
MSRAAKIALTVGISLVCDGMIFYLFYQQARIKDAEPTGLWWLSTITIAVLALAPLYELARKPRLLECIVAAIFSILPACWLALCLYAAHDASH